MICGIVLVAVVLAVWTIADRYDGRIYRMAEAVPERPVAVVFGAAYWPDGTHSDVVKDRCTGQTAFVALAQAFGSRVMPFPAGSVLDL